MAEIIERIPHKSVAYAFLEIRAGSANEFESLRAEALRKAPHYGFAQERPADPTPAAKPTVAAKSSAAPAPAESPVEAVVETAAVAPEPAASAPTGNADQAPSPTTQAGLSPRDKARAKMAAKKEA